MSRLRPLSSALLSFGLLLVVRCCRHLPDGRRNSRTRCRPDPEPGTAVGGAIADLGQLQPILDRPQRRSHRPVHHRVRPGRLRQSGWGASQVGGDPRARHRSADRVAVGQPGRTRGVGGRHGGRDVVRPGEHRHHPQFRPGWVRPARRGPLHAAVALPHRRRVRRLPARTDGRLQPDRRGAHRADQPAIGPGMRDQMGKGFLANAGTASVARDMDMVRQALGDDQINYLGYSYGTELGTAYLEKFADHVRAMVLDGAIDPTVDPVQENIRQMAGFQTAFNDYAADCARSAACPLGTDPTQFVNRYHALVDPLVAKPGRDLGPARPELRRRDHRHDQCALHPAALEVPDQRSARVAARHRRRRPAAARRRLPGPRQERALRQRPGRVQRRPLCRRAGADGCGDLGVRRSTNPPGRAVLELRAVHRQRAPRPVRAVAGAADVRAARASPVSRRARSSSSPRRTTRPPRIRPG